MKDEGLNSGLVQKFDTSKSPKGAFYGFRKMFWKYLKKLGVVFYDTCCIEAGTSNADVFPIGYSVSQGGVVVWNGTEYVPQEDFVDPNATTTTTTTAAPTTTTTTTAAPTTTTTSTTTTTTLP